MRRVSFQRASGDPVGTDRIYYNDEEGIEAMAARGYRVEALQRAAGETVEWGIRGRWGFLPAFKEGGRRYVLGDEGDPYSIYVKNRSQSRLEVVLSVDGLDVMDGRPASYGKRGYVISPGESLTLKGWRSDWNRVARFEFSSVAGSYSSRRHGDARNAGVIGLAVFAEKGSDLWKWNSGELRRREEARPFATAP